MMEIKLPVLAAPRYRILTLLLVLAASLGSVYQKNARADAGGWPTRTPTITPVVTSTNTPLPTVIIVLTPLPTLTPGIFVPTPTPLPTSIPPAAIITPTPPAGGPPAACWPIGLIILLASIIGSIVIFGRRFLPTGGP